MPEPLVTATVLNPDSEDGPWRVSLVLSVEGKELAADVIEHSGNDWDEKAGPVMDRFRAVVTEGGYTPPR